MKRFYNQKYKPKVYEEGDKMWLNAKHIITGQPKKKLDWRCLGPFKITKKYSNIAYQLRLPKSWHMHPTFHILKLCRFKEDEFNRPNLHVTLNVRGENWKLAKILDLCLLNNKLEYLVNWKDLADLYNTWEQETCMQIEAPCMVTTFH